MVIDFFILFVLIVHVHIAQYILGNLKSYVKDIRNEDEAGMEGTDGVGIAT